MPFSEVGITLLPEVWQGADLEIPWLSIWPDGTIYQCYIDRVKVYSGTNTFCVIPMPSDTIQIDVGAVGPTEANTDFSADLPVPPQTKAELTFYGGTFESPSIAGFYIYSSLIPGGAVSFTTPVANIPAYTGPPTDGWNLGPWNIGGWGEDAASYSWESDTLASGIWTFSVNPYDMAGNVGTGSTATVTINAPPIEVAPYSDMTRLKYTFNASTEVATLTWNASPSA